MPLSLIELKRHRTTVIAQDREQGRLFQELELLLARIA
jgi:hypothetical protein